MAGIVVTELLMAYCAFEATNAHLVAPVPASREELLLSHSAEYVGVVARLSNVLSLSKGDGGERVSAWHYGFRPDETPVFPGMYESTGLKVGAAPDGGQVDRWRAGANGF